MPTIVIVNPKGGACKSTTALILASILAERTEVTMVDADPNRAIQNWSKGGHCPANLSVVGDANEENIAEVIDSAASKTPFVVVDLEGTAAKIVVVAITRADLVIIPTQASHLDTKQAARAVRMIKQHEVMMQRVKSDWSLPFAVLLCRTNSAIRKKSLRHAEKTLAEANIPVLKAEINERVAFEAMFAYDRPLQDLDPKQVSGVDKAIENAKLVTAEVVAMLRNSAKREAA